MRAGQSIAVLGGVVTLAMEQFERSRNSTNDDEVLADSNDSADSPRTSRMTLVGFAVALCGALLFAGATFLPHLSFPYPADCTGCPPPQTMSFFHMVLGPDFVGTVQRGFLTAYGEALMVGVMAWGGLMGGPSDRWSVAVLATSAAWANGWTEGTLLSSGISPLTGYWIVRFGVLVAVAGGVVAVVGLRRDSPPSSAQVGGPSLGSPET